MLTFFRRDLAMEEVAVRERIRLVQADICTFALSETFDFILLEDDGFLYLLTQEDQLTALDRVRTHLSDEGFFLLCFSPAQREWRQGKGSQIDPVRQIKETLCAWRVEDGKGGETIVQEGVERRRLVYPAELELLLRTAELEVVERWGDLAKTPFVDPVKQEIHFLIRKRPAGE
jgi:hypothetical protein